MMKIDELPIEMLIKIFSHLRVLKNVSLVNRKFYDAACKVSDPRICLKLFPPYPVDNEDELKYIEQTTRKISNLVIEMGPTLKALRKLGCVPIASVIQKFSPNIKKLTIRGQFKFSDILDILTMASNAEFIEFEEVWIMEDHAEAQASLLNDTNGDLDLANLKTLKIMSCVREVAAIFNRLPRNVLRELVLNEHDPVELNDLFKRQGTIKIITIKYHSWSGSEGVIPLNIFDNQKLEALRCTLRMFDSSNFGLILSKQKNLKRLEVEISENGDGFINVVTNQLTELETLRMRRLRMEYVGSTILRNIKKLKKLKYLQLELGPDSNVVAHLEEFATFEHSNITTLRVSLFDIPRHVLVPLAKSVQNLKVLDFVYLGGGQNLVTTLNMILDIFNYVERLSFTLPYGPSFMGTVSQRNSANPKLIELNIAKVLLLDTESIETFIKCYPNLKRLQVNQLTISTLKSILNGFRKLESLSFKVENKMLDIDETAFLDCLRKDGKNLKYFEIRGKYMGKWKLCAEIEAELTAIYEVVETRNGRLRMGVDRKV